MKIKNKPSMRKHLVLMFLGTSIVLHVLVGGVIQYAVQSHFYNQDYHHITEKIAVIKQANLPGRFDTKTAESFDITALKIWALENDVVTYQNSDIKLSVAAVTFLLNNTDVKQSWKWEQGGNRYLAFSFVLSAENTLVVGVNINHHVTFFKEINWVIFWAIVLALLISLIYSVFIVNRGLRPLKKLESYLEKVSPGRLDIRIPVQELPVELEALSHVSNTMLDRLDHGFQRLSDFSSDIAHELRTPLSNMTTQTQVVLSRDRKTADYQDALESNLEELERISKTINDTLYLAKSENSLLHQNNEKLDLSQEISRLVEYYNIAGEEKGVSISLVGQGELYCDKAMFERAINNLLSNAIRHASINSAIKVIIKQFTGNLTISIINYGDTIPESSLPFIFDRFYRADKSRVHTHSVGAGLGLAITRSIIEAYGGTIVAKSSNDMTEFLITFKNA